MACMTSACKWQVPGTCTYYSGDHIAGFNISNGDNLNVVVAKITSFLIGGGGGDDSETANSVIDTNSIDFSVSGTFNRVISGNVKINPQLDNKLIISGSGLYASPATSSTSVDSGVLTLIIDGVEHDIPLDTGGVSSFFGRTGDVIPQAGDYNFADVGNKPGTLAGYGIGDPIVLESNSYSNPVWIISLDKAKSGLGNVDNTSDVNKPLSTASVNALALKANIASPTFTGIPAVPTAIVGTSTTQAASTAFVQAAITAVSAGVTSFNSRSGVVIPATNDYTWAQVNKATSSFADITTRSASDINTGTLAAARLAANVPLLDVNNTFTGTMTFSNLAGSGTRIVKASALGLLSAGTITSSDVGLGNVANVDTTNASNISSGTLADARLSTNVPLKGSINTFTADQTITGNLSVSGTITNSALTTALGLKAPLASPALTGVPTAPTATLGDNSTTIATTAFVLANGSATTDASLLTSGTLADGRLSANVPLINGANSFTAKQTVTLTTAQLRLAYDVSNYTDFTVNNIGELTIAPTSLITKFTGSIAFGGTGSNIYVPNINSVGSSTISEFILAGATGTVFRISERSNVGGSILAGYSYASHLIGTQTITEASSGVTPMISQLAIKPLTITGAAGTVTDTATLYISGAASATVSGGNYALVVDSGDTRLDGNVFIGGDTIMTGNATAANFYKIVILPSDVINNNSTANTLSDITGLSFTAIAGETYIFRFVIYYDAAAITTGARFSINGPAATNVRYNSHWTWDAGLFFNHEGMTSYGLPAAADTASLTAGNRAIVEGIIQPSSTGAVIARFASEVSSSAITALGGLSYVEYKKIS